VNLPARFLWVEDMPRNAMGKLERLALRKAAEE